MKNYHQNTTKDEQQLWEAAKKEVSFKYHLLSYVIVISSFWITWAFSENYSGHETIYPWPVFPMLGWGMGLFFHYFGAHMFPKSYSAQKENQ